MFLVVLKATFVYAELFPNQTKSCVDLCGIYRLAYPEDTCQCDSLCSAGGDCCPDFIDACPDTAANAANAAQVQTKCHLYDSQYKFVGIHTVVGCPTTVKGENETKWPQLVQKCRRGLESGSIVDVTTDDVLFSIPVTSLSDNVTYANVFCALCNGVSQYEFWSVDIKGKAKCFDDTLSNMMREATHFNLTAWRQELASGKCALTGQVVPFASKKIKTWMESNRKTESQSRLSQYCLNNDYFLKCKIAPAPTEQTPPVDPELRNANQTSSERTEEHSSCVAGRRNAYTICQHCNFRPYDLCENCKENLNRVSDFDASFFDPKEVFFQNK